MLGVKIVTYMRQTETLNANIKKMMDIMISLYPKTELVIFTNKERVFDYKGIKIRVINYAGTKYKRLLYLIKNEQSECIYLSLDNDIDVNKDNIIDFLHFAASGRYDIGWGRIYAQNKSGLISNLVAVDKHLSHDIIRPFLWNCGYGISIPGQLFFINLSSFKNQLYEIDTYLDDLAIGKLVSDNKRLYKVLRSNKILGCEEPKENFYGLVLQRKRWAKGYYQIFKYCKRQGDLRKLLILYQDIHIIYFYTV